MDIFQTVKKKIAMFSDLDSGLISRETTLIENLQFDSFTLMCLGGELSEQYKIEINAEDIVSFTNVGDIVDYIEGKIK